MTPVGGVGAQVPGLIADKRVAVSEGVVVPLFDRLVQWQRNHGRHGLPWQQTRDPYRVWLSAVTLQ